jgi:hypothetical protein
VTTKRDDALIIYARLLDEAEGVPPTVREFADALWTKGEHESIGLSWILKLVEAGWIRLPPALLARHPDSVYGLTRAYVLTEAGRARLAELAAVGSPQ